MDPTERDGRTSKHEPADRVRHVLLGTSLILGPALIAIANFVRPAVDWENTREVVATAASESSMWQTAGLFELFGFMLLVPAIIAAAELIRSRYPGLALSTVILVSVSAMLIVGSIFFTMMFAGAAGQDEVAIARYLTATEGITGMAVLLPLYFTAMLGYLFLSFGLWRTRATPRWVPVLFVASFVVTFLATTAAVTNIGNLGVAVASAGMAWAYLIGEEDPAPAITPKAKAVAV